MNISVSITGERELINKLNKLTDKVAGQALENAVTAGALLVQNAAKRKAPFRTGNLRRSIHIGGHSDQSELTDSTGGDIGGNKNDGKSAEVLVGTDVVYAATQEFGRGNIPAHPYLRPAFDENQEKVAKEIGKALKDLLRAI